MAINTTTTGQTVPTEVEAEIVAEVAPAIEVAHEATIEGVHMEAIVEISIEVDHTREAQDKGSATSVASKDAGQ
jgi:hypothetical protein